MFEILRIVFFSWVYFFGYIYIVGFFPIVVKKLLKFAAMCFLFVIDDLMDSIPESFTGFYYFLQSISYKGFVFLFLTSQQIYFCNCCKIHVFGFSLDYLLLLSFLCIIVSFHHRLYDSFSYPWFPCNLFIFLGSLFSRSIFVGVLSNK